MEPTIEEKIAKALKDTASGLATKEECKQYVADETTKLFDQQKAESTKLLDEAQASIKELHEANESLSSQVKRLRSGGFAAVKTPEGRYNGAWGNIEQAKNFGLFILSEVMHRPDARKSYEGLGFERRSLNAEDVVVRAMGEDLATGGSALVPTEFIPNLIALIENFGTFRRNANPWPMSGQSGYAPLQTGDATVYCPATGVTVLVSHPEIKQVGLQALKWMTLTPIDSELDEDAAIAVGELVGRSIARAFAKQEDACGLVGDGTSTYFGIKGARALLREVDATVTNVKGLHVQGTPGAWSAITLADLLAVAGLMPVYSADGLDDRWYCHKAFYMTVMVGLALSAGGAFASEVINTGYTRNPSFLGQPVEFAQVMPSTKPAADHCPLLYANLRMGAYLGDRRRTTIDTSREAYFTTDQIGIRGTERVAVTPYGVGDTTNPGPIVGLWADISA